MGSITPVQDLGVVVENPVVQGGMGVGISLAGLAGAVAKAGGMGIISATRDRVSDPELKKILKKLI